jgi:hypothetical protein
MESFDKFSEKVKEKFLEISKGEIYKLDVSKDDLWDLYLSSFPDGTNPVYRQNSFHDCNCCKSFVKNIGNVASIKNGKITTVWDIDIEYPYNIVCQKISEFLKDSYIRNVFRTKFTGFGSRYTIKLEENNETTRFNHFYCKVDSRHRSNKNINKSDDANSFLRALNAFDANYFRDVLLLIDDNNLYRGQEFKKQIKDFLSLKNKFDKLNSERAKHLFAWEHINSPCVFFKNSVIGTLFSDLADGDDFDVAVAKFESKVAPTNYKRPKSIITPLMIKDAMKRIKDLGIEDSLNRRFASIEDVSVNNVLFVDNSVRSKMRDSLGDIENILMSEAKKKKVSTRASRKISVDKFINNIIPESSELYILVKNANRPNFFSLITSQNQNAKRIFTWNNNFSWSYDGNLTDSYIKDRVKRAGGKTDAALRVSLAWFNYDDLDIHCRDSGGREISFANKSGILDVDMNAGSGGSREPVENLHWLREAPDGEYKVWVRQFNRRESIDVGFEIEIETQDGLRKFSYEKPVIDDVMCFSFSVKSNRIENLSILDKSLTEDTRPQKIWGVDTEAYCKVETVMLSPNYWDGQEIGNKHLFFSLDGCLNTENARGFYNEFLSSDFHEHRKVFEVLADKIKCEPTERQVSGVGFSSTKKETFLVKCVKDNRQFFYEVEM